MADDWITGKLILEKLDLFIEGYLNANLALPLTFSDNSAVKLPRLSVLLLFTYLFICWKKSLWYK